MVFRVFSQNYSKDLLQIAYVSRQLCILSNAKNRGSRKIKKKTTRKTTENDCHDNPTLPNLTQPNTTTLVHGKSVMASECAWCGEKTVLVS